MKINVEELSALGFHEYKPSVHAHYDRAWQKSIRDETGAKKYFLDIYEYDFSRYKHLDEFEDKQYEVFSQVYKKGTHEAMNITFLSDSLDSCTDVIEKMFDAGILENYE